jgi:hypothetical protein
MTLTVGLGLAIPTAYPSVRWMLEVLAITVSVLSFALSIYQLILDTRDEFMDKKDSADALASKWCHCCKRIDKSRAAEDIAFVVDQDARP